MKRILVVDDELGTMRALYRVLKSEGFEISASLSAEEAIATINMLNNTSDEIDLVVTDIQMPGKTGMDLLLRIKELYPLLPVIIITGYGTPQLERVFRETGCIDFLYKPFSPQELVESIKKVFANN